MKFCCERFQVAFENHDKEGVSIVARSEPPIKPFFVLQHRCVPRQTQQEFADALAKSGFMKHVTIAGEFAVGYCPWCGRSLSRFYMRELGNLTKGPI